MKYTMSGKVVLNSYCSSRDFGIVFPGSPIEIDDIGESSVLARQLKLKKGDKVTVTFEKTE